MQAAIEARAVTHRTRTGDVTVRDVSLTVDPGELVAIIGGSGSGKTTLLNALSGQCPPTSGTVERQPGARIGYVPAGDSLYQVLPLVTALRYTAALRGLRDSGAAVAGALTGTGLTPAAAAPVGALNPGERKRADIAAELLVNPAVLFLEEPTAALDPAQAAQVTRLLHRLSDSGTAVVFTTNNPLDAAQCAKVAVLATGGHLAFFGTPAAARGYFGADSLEEIYERLSGVGDPAAAWSRRFFYFSQTAAGSAPVPTLPRAPGPMLLIPDQAGPHSAGRPSLPSALDIDLKEWPDQDPDQGNVLVPEPAEPRQQEQPAAAAPGAARQVPVLVRRNAEILARDWRQQVTLAAAPLAVLLVFCLLLAVGALNGPAAVTLAWAVLGGLATGLAYELPARARESGVLRRERFAGVSLRAFLTAKAVLFLPALAAADAIILAVPAVADRLQAGFGVSYAAVCAASLLGLAATLCIPAPSVNLSPFDH